MFQKQSNVQVNSFHSFSTLAECARQQCAVLHALHRRIVLDEARDTIINRYGFTIGQLRLGGYNTHGEQRVALFELVRAVRAELNPEDATLLSQDALVMVFDSGKHSVHENGNHRASEGDVSLAVLAADWSDMQRESLKRIYKFPHNVVPQLY